MADVSPCLSQPCQNNGTCVRSGMTQNYTCHCVPGFTGFLCQTGTVCSNYLLCWLKTWCTTIWIENRFSHYSLTYFLFSNRVDINECLSFPCQNGGSCLNLINSFQCQCLPGYTGIHCEIGKKEYLTLRKNQEVSFRKNQEISLQVKWHNSFFYSDIDECASSPCQNQATCNDFVNYFNCSCRAGFTGGLCEIGEF